MFWKKKRKKNAKQFRCSQCGEIHNELPALGFKTPFHYDILNLISSAAHYVTLFIFCQQKKS